MSKISKEELKDLQESQGKLNAIKHDLGLLETLKSIVYYIYMQMRLQNKKNLKKL